MTKVTDAKARMSEGVAEWHAWEENEVPASQNPIMASLGMDGAARSIQSDRPDASKAASHV